MKKEMSLYRVSENQLLELLTRYGGNPRCLASITGESSRVIAKEILEMQRNHHLTIFPAVFSEGLGLGKYLILARLPHKIRDCV